MQVDVGAGEWVHWLGEPPGWAVCRAVWGWEGLQAWIACWPWGPSTPGVGVGLAAACPESLKRGLGHLRVTNHTEGFPFSRRLWLQGIFSGCWWAQTPTTVWEGGEMSTRCQFPWGWAPTQEKGKIGRDESAWSVWLIIDGAEFSCKGLNYFYRNWNQKLKLSAEKMRVMFCTYDF